MRRCKVHDNEESTTRQKEWNHGDIVKKKSGAKQKMNTAYVFLAPRKQIRMQKRDRVENNENE